MVLFQDELAQVVADNPFPDETTPTCLHAVGNRRPPGPDQMVSVAAAAQRARDRGSRDDARVVGRAVYLHTPDGLGRGELSVQVARAGGVAAEPSSTIRNRATVRRLLIMGDG